MRAFSPCKYTGPLHEAECKLGSEMASEPDGMKEFMKAMPKLRQEFKGLNDGSRWIDSEIDKVRREGTARVERLEREGRNEYIVSKAAAETEDRIMNLASSGEDLFSFGIELRSRYLKYRLPVGLAPLGVIKLLGVDLLKHLVWEARHSSGPELLFDEPILFVAIRLGNDELAKALVEECRKRLSFSDQESILNTSDSHFRHILDVARVEASPSIRALFEDWNNDIEKRNYRDPEWYNRNGVSKYSTLPFMY